MSAEPATALPVGDAASVFTYGPSALATWANAVSIIRLAASPVLFAVLAAEPASWAALALWIVLCGSDGFDGWLARRHGTTRSGAFLDPLADKVLVLGALIVLTAVGVFWWLPVVAIAGRELTISAFRSYWGRRGRAVPATAAAKAKTVTQEVAVGLAVLPPLADSTLTPAAAVLWLAVALTLVTGVQYLRAGGGATRATGST